MTTEINALRLEELLQDMNLPVNRKNVRDETLRWLCRNLGARNDRHPNFVEARKLLVELARTRALFKRSELQSL
jgi:hypothetical protein